MTLLQALGVVLAGVAAGTINAVVGSGTLITFPTLLAVGLPPVAANVTNTVGLVPGSLTAAIGYRRELSGQRSRLLDLGVFSLLGALTGGVLLLTLPSSVFDAVVPVLVLLGVVLVLLQPRIARWVAGRRGGLRPYGWGVRAGVLAAGVYGGYFGAAQGVLLIALLGTLVDHDLQRVNAAKNVLAGLVNLVAGVLFVVVADVRWSEALLIALGSIAGGWLGARVGRRLPPLALRCLVAVVGLVAVVRLLA